MSFASLDLNVHPDEKSSYRLPSGGYEYTGRLYTQGKIISSIAVKHLPITLPEEIYFTDYEQASVCPVSELPSFEFLPYFHPSKTLDRRAEWKLFLTFLYKSDKVVLIPVNGWELFCRPPDVFPDETTPLRVCYRKVSEKGPRKQQTPARPGDQDGDILRPVGGRQPRPGKSGDLSNLDLLGRSTGGPTPAVVATRKAIPDARPRLGIMHPRYLQTLAQTHASWLFGGIAELVDNARDASASRLNIFVTMVKMKGVKDVIPMLKVEDNGKGMTHAEIVRMLGFGHSAPTDNDEDKIGHFGVGFKTGSMRIGKDVLVLSQSEDSRSIGFLSSSYNADKEELEVPIVTYRKVHGIMELDLSVHTANQGRCCLEAVKKYSPFSEFEFGSLFEKIGNGSSKNGTHIFIYNLDKWGEEYFLQWDKEVTFKQQRHVQKDIIIRSRRVRSRPGQTSREVPLDYSLRSYLEVLFLDPRMIITVQGSKVKSRRLAESLSTTKRFEKEILGKHVELTLGRSTEEYQRGNCGIFLYWHGRLIEAYRRVGGMIHSADTGRGVIGVIDVTPLMDNREGRIRVLNTKQGFEDNQEYSLLEDWLAFEFNKYWYEYFDKIEIVTKVEDDVSFSPDREWVQCDKCQKWRKLPKGVHSEDLPDEWFCYMEPFAKTCKEPEEEADDNVVTVGQQTAGTKDDKDERAKRDYQSHMNDEEEVSQKKRIRLRNAFYNSERL